MTDREIAIRKKLRDNLPHFALKCLKIRAKRPIIHEGKKQKIVPFEFNRAQKYVDGRLNQQKLETGKVRALLLKGRQQGMSTYVGGRYYHKTSHSEGIKTFILAHLDDATNNLFNMVKRFHKHNNPLLLPSTSHSNRKELIFDKLDSAYSLGTAGSGNVGRSDTIDYFHGSEVAFWKNIQEIQTGVFQAANEAEEIILESTANGFDPMFHPMWQAAESGLSEYIAIFVPWFWQYEYTMPLPEDWEPTTFENELYELYSAEGLTWKHILWRRNKIASEFKGDELLFQQEYPCCAHEAFVVTGLDSFIKPDVVIKARKRKDVIPRGAHIVGIDPSRGDNDSTAFCHRQGGVAWLGKVYKTPDTTAIEGEAIRLFREPQNPENPVDWMFIDIGGLGGPIYDHLSKTAYGPYIIPVNFGDVDVYNPDRYANKRVEMWGDVRDWLQDTTFPPSIDDRDDFQSDICAPGYKYDNRQRYLLEAKVDMKKRGQRSPDMGDALALTFAQPVSERHSRGGSMSSAIPKRRRLA